MDQAESSPLPGQPDRPQRRAREEEPQPSAASALDHPVVAGYDGSPSSRHALAYAAGLSRRRRRRTGHRRAGSPLAPRGGLRPGLAGPARALPGHRRALTRAAAAQTPARRPARARLAPPEPAAAKGPWPLLARPARRQTGTPG